jgi:hypothetical protein
MLKKIENKQKEWHPATKPLKKKNVASKSNKHFFFAGILKVNDENSRNRIQDPDPDPPQNVMDPQHCFKVTTSVGRERTSNYHYMALCVYQLMVAGGGGGGCWSFFLFFRFRSSCIVRDGKWNQKYTEILKFYFSRRRDCSGCIDPSHIS